MHERHVERRGLAGPRRPGDEHDSVAHPERLLELGAQRRIPYRPGESRLGEPVETVRIEETHHHLLSEGRGDGRYSNVHKALHAAVGVRDAHASVERPAPFGDVHAALRLHPRHDLHEVAEGNAPLQYLEDSVDP